MGLDNWHELPFVTKEDIRTAGDSARNLSDQICNEVFTGGTTGQPLVTYKGDREQKYIRKFYNEVFAQKYKKPLKRALQINNPYHGHLVPVPVPMHSHKIGVYDGGSFNYGRDHILYRARDDRNVEPRCSILVGLERCLRAFTNEAILSQTDTKRAKLEAIISYSQYLTPRWRRIQEDTWGCLVIDRFGLSEVFGGATQDANCGWYFFDPVLYAEVVHPVTREIIYEGMGELILTSLVPFQETQPMIRYRTGDLVKVTHKSRSRPKQLAIKPLGRIKFGVMRARDGLFVLTPADIADVMDSIENIKRAPRFLDSPQVSDPYAIGHPMYSVSYSEEHDIMKINISILLENDSKQRQVKNLVMKRLLDKSSILKQGVRETTIHVSIDFPEELHPDLISHAN